DAACGARPGRRLDRGQRAQPFVDGGDQDILQTEVRGHARIIKRARRSRGASGAAAAGIGAIAVYHARDSEVPGNPMSMIRAALLGLCACLSHAAVAQSAATPSDPISGKAALGYLATSGNTDSKSAN